MNDEATLQAISAAITTNADRKVRARRAAELVRNARGYRWVGIYDVSDEYIELVDHTGDDPPAFIRFSIEQGLSGEAVRAERTVISNDVAHDSRYLTAFASTGSEMIVPIAASDAGAIVGTLDIESEETNAFDDADREFAERCAHLLIALYAHKDRETQNP